MYQNYGGIKVFRPITFRELVRVGEVGGSTQHPSLMTHHHHSLSLGNLCQFSGGHTLGTCRPLGGKSR